MKAISRKVIFVKRNHVRCANKRYMKFAVYLQTTVFKTFTNTVLAASHYD